MRTAKCLADNSRSWSRAEPHEEVELAPGEIVRVAQGGDGHYRASHPLVQIYLQRFTL